MNNLNKNIGAKLKYRRKLRGLSQAALGKALGGVSYQQIQKYEYGADAMNAIKLQQAAKFLNTTPSYFFDDEDFPTVTTYESKMLKAIRKITQEKNKILLRAVLKFLAD